MKIGIITDAIDDHAAGIGTYVENLVGNLLKIDKKKKNEYVFIHHSENKWYAGKKEIIIPIPKILPFRREIRKIYIMPKILKKHDFDLIHETTQIGPFFLGAKYKKVVTICDLVPLKYPETQPLFSVIHHKIGLPVILKKVDRIITISQNTKKDIIELFKIGPEKIDVIYLAANNVFKPIQNLLKINSFKKKYGLDYPFFLMVGTIEPRKNISLAINSLNELKKKKWPHKLVIIGRKGWKFQKIFKQIESLGLEKEVLFLNKISNDDLCYFYNCAELLIYPSLYEGFGLPPLEAMRCRCPVIASNNSSLPEVVGDAAIKINPESSTELTKAIEEVVTNKKLRRELVKKGIQQAKKFSWKSCAEETLKLYEAVLQ